MAIEKIETVTVGAGGAASIEFTSIPQDGVDLVLVMSLRSDRAANSDSAGLTLNSSTSNFSWIWLRGQGTFVQSASGTDNRTGLWANGNTATANTFANGQIIIANYTSSAAKSISIDGVGEDVESGQNPNLTIQASLWNDTSAITSVGISSFYGTEWLEHSTASLYKITAD